MDVRPRPQARLVAVVLVVCALAACASDGGGPSVRVLAAASLAETFVPIAERFEAETGVTVEVSFGPSSGLREQILAGAPADVFAAASVDEVLRLEAADAVASWAVFAGNELALAVPADNPGGVTELADLSQGSLLVGLCAAEVPCGRLAREALEAAGVDAALDTTASDVRALRTQLLSGDLDAALLYRTDVTSAAGALVAIELPPEARVATQYAIATLRTSDDPAAAAAFVDYVRGADAQAVLAEAGFSAP